MKYDDASWHYEGDFPPELPPSAGATHIGMFLAWACLNGLTSEDLEEGFGQLTRQLKVREITPGEFFIRVCDEKLVDEDLSEEGNAFARYYYSSGEKFGDYIMDYSETLGSPEEQTSYHIADTWDNFDRIDSVIRRRFEKWKRARPDRG